jgi:DNA anti-recombination protein RmuC
MAIILIIKLNNIFKKIDAIVDKVDNFADSVEKFGNSLDKIISATTYTKMIKNLVGSIFYK